MLSKFLTPDCRTVVLFFIIFAVKVKWSRYRAGVAQRVGRGIALLFHDRGTRRGWVVSSTPPPHLPPGKTRYPFYIRLSGPQGRSGLAKNLVLNGIHSPTVHPIVSRYTDWAARPINICGTFWNNVFAGPTRKEMWKWRPD